MSRAPSSTSVRRGRPASIAAVAILPGTERALSLEVLSRIGRLSREALCRRVGSLKHPQRFQDDTIEPLLAADLIARYGSGAHVIYGITVAGLTELARLQARSPFGLAATPADMPGIAAERMAPSSQPMPRGEFRINRPGAYDFERCPSRIGNLRVYRDGRREPVDD